MTSLRVRPLALAATFDPIQWIVAATFILVLALPARAQTLTTLYTFTGNSDGADPSSVILDPAGNLYGTTFYGGNLSCAAPFGCGVVFMLSASAQYSVLHAFTSTPDGQLPLAFGGLLRAPNGVLYGETFAGGTDNCGTIFSENPATGRETILYSFTCFSGGLSPTGGLSHDSAGNLYGTTNFGGIECKSSSSCGTVFKLDTKHNLTTLYSFTGFPDGYQPNGGVIRDAAGNLYGTTVSGGSTSCPNRDGCGILFKIDTAGNETIVHTFGLGTDGGLPFGGLIQDGQGNFYGTADAFGTRANGVVFKINGSGAETVLYDFSGGADGGSPRANLVFDSKGNLYGTTTYGGTGACDFGCGTVFKLDRFGKETVLYNFTGGADGAAPISTLALDAAGNLYGTTISGGDLNCNNFSGGCGTVFKLTP